MNIFKRLLKIGQSEIHALVDKMEDPISMTEQGIRDLKEELATTTERYAKAKAFQIRSDNKIAENKEKIKQLEDKAMRILLKANTGEITTEAANKLAKEALLQKKDLIEHTLTLQTQVEGHKLTLNEVAQNLEILQLNISKWEKELTTLRAKQKVSTASELANKQIANMENNSTIDMLERLKAKVATDASLADAYGEIAAQNAADKFNQLDEVNKAVSEELNELKKQLGLKNRTDM
ncbi:PspA/IM30 family protein [Sphingobacterium alkalisoli]|uniref:PspA/IM30 family protein n=2 Tax=Sphingobacterium alkalisoli TaxID=1874115 RepID=A0A4U0GZH5_9SPHI|nr:PspA/IM30 family protein [Sphingobacterium alkalisoli]